MGHACHIWSILYPAIFFGEGEKGSCDLKHLRLLHSSQAIDDQNNSLFKGAFVNGYI